jgi:hypothetical protein
VKNKNLDQNVYQNVRRNVQQPMHSYYVVNQSRHRKKEKRKKNAIEERER